MVTVWSQFSRARLESRVQLAQVARAKRDPPPPFIHTTAKRARAPLLGPERPRPRADACSLPICYKCCPTRVTRDFGAADKDGPCDDDLSNVGFRGPFKVKSKRNRRDTRSLREFAFAVELRKSLNEQLGRSRASPHLGTAWAIVIRLRNCQCSLSHCLLCNRS